MLKNVQLYYFSPTGGTKACGEILCKALSQNIKTINLGLKESLVISECDLTIFAVPVYGGRIPTVVAEKISTLNGTGKKAVTLVVYGTRAYEDALLELNNITSASGFHIVASGAVVAQHSVVPAVGQGRPDEDDIKSITKFAKNILNKLDSNDKTPVAVPGNFPYKDSMNLPASPICLSECTHCGKCVSICPTTAMSLEDDVVKTDVDACILCLACTTVCPKNARVLPTPLQENMNEKLSALIAVRRENEYFL